MAKLQKKDYIDAKLLMRKNIMSSATIFKKLLGKYVLYVFNDNTYIEVFYRKTSFSHLTGVDTDLNAADFYQKALSRQLTIDQFYFNNKHPYDLAKKKTARLNELNKFTTDNLIVLQDIKTESMTFKFGLMDVDLTLCFSENLDKKTKEKIDDYYIPASFRVEDKSVDKSQSCKIVKNIFIKKNKNSKYQIMSHGNIDDIDNLTENIKEKIDVKTLKETKSTEETE